MVRLILGLVRAAFKRISTSAIYCLVGPRNYILDRNEGAFAASGLEIFRLGKVNDKLALPSVRLATMHRVKGWNTIT